MQWKFKTVYLKIEKSFKKKFEIALQTILENFTNYSINFKNNLKNFKKLSRNFKKLSRNFTNFEI